MVRLLGTMGPRTGEAPGRGLQGQLVMICRRHTLARCYREPRPPSPHARTHRTAQRGRGAAAFTHPPFFPLTRVNARLLISGRQTQTYTRADLRADRKADNRARMLTQSLLPVRLVPLSRDQSACPSALPARASAAVMCSRRSLVPHAPPSPRCQVFKHCAAHTAARDPGTTLASELPLICRKTFKNES